MKKNYGKISFLMFIAFLFTCIFSVTNLSKEVYAQGNLVAHYKFDNDFSDSSGNGNNGTNIGNISFVDGILGKGAKFDGQSYIEVANSETINFDKAFSFSVWLYKDDISPNSVQPILHKLPDGMDDYSPYSLRDDDFYPFLGIIDEYGNDSGVYSDTRVDFQNWYLLTVTYDSKNVKMYYNGALKTNKIYPSDIIASGGNLYIGSYIKGETSFYKGIMDDLRLFNTALSPSEVEQLFSEGKNHPFISEPKKLVAHYKFDGDTKDSSGIGNDGTILGGADGISFVDSIVGKGAKFDGASYIEVEDNDSLDLENGFTFSTWLFKNENREMDTQPILSKFGSSMDKNNSSYALVDHDNFPVVNLYDEFGNHSGVEAQYDVQLDGWYLITVSYDGKSVKFYHNGVLRDTKEFKGYIYHSSGKLLIGSDTNGTTSLFKGMMDDLRIYNYALSPEEVKALFDVSASKNSMVLRLDNPIMKVNGESKEIDPGVGTAPVSVEGRTMVPIRAIVEAMGGTIAWDGKEQRVTIHCSNTKIDLWIAQTKALINGESKEADVAPRIMGGRTMLPLRFVTENLGAKVLWDAATSSITISY